MHETMSHTNSISSSRGVAASTTISHSPHHMHSSDDANDVRHTCATTSLTRGVASVYRNCSLYEPDIRRFYASTDDSAIFLEDSVDAYTARRISSSPSALAILSPQRMFESDRELCDLLAHNTHHSTQTLDTSPPSCTSSSSSSSVAADITANTNILPYSVLSSSSSSPEDGTSRVLNPSSPWTETSVVVAERKSDNVLRGDCAEQKSQSPVPPPPLKPSTPLHENNMNNSNSNSDVTSTEANNNEPKTNYSNNCSRTSNGKTAKSISTTVNKWSSNSGSYTAAPCRSASRSPAAVPPPRLSEPSVPLSEFRQMEKERNRLEKMYEHQRVLYEEMAERHSRTHDKLQEKIVEVVALSSRNEENKRFIRQLKREIAESRGRVVAFQNRVLEEAKSERAARGQLEARLSAEEKQHRDALERQAHTCAALESLIRDLISLRPPAALAMVGHDARDYAHSINKKHKHQNSTSNVNDNTNTYNNNYATDLVSAATSSAFVRSRSKRNGAVTNDSMDMYTKDANSTDARKDETVPNLQQQQQQQQHHLYIIQVEQLDALLRAAYAKNTALFSDLLRYERQGESMQRRVAQLEEALAEAAVWRRRADRESADVRRTAAVTAERFIAQVEEQQQLILTLRRSLARVTMTHPRGRGGANTRSRQAEHSDHRTALNKHRSHDNNNTVARSTDISNNDTDKCDIRDDTARQKMNEMHEGNAAGARALGNAAQGNGTDESDEMLDSDEWDCAHEDGQSRSASRSSESTLSNSRSHPRLCLGDDDEFAVDDDEDNNVVQDKGNDDTDSANISAQKGTMSTFINDEDTKHCGKLRDSVNNNSDSNRVNGMSYGMDCNVALVKKVGCEGVNPWQSFWSARVAVPPLTNARTSLTQPQQQQQNVSVHEKRHAISESSPLLQHEAAAVHGSAKFLLCDSAPDEIPASRTPSCADGVEASCVHSPTHSPAVPHSAPSLAAVVRRRQHQQRSFSQSQSVKSCVSFPSAGQPVLDSSDSKNKSNPSKGKDKGTDDEGGGAEHTNEYAVEYGNDDRAHATAWITKGSVSTSPAVHEMSHCPLQNNGARSVAQASTMNKMMDAIALRLRRTQSALSSANINTPPVSFRTAAHARQAARYALSTSVGRGGSRSIDEHSAVSVDRGNSMEDEGEYDKENSRAGGGGWDGGARVRATMADTKNVCTTPLQRTRLVKGHVLSAMEEKGINVQAIVKNEAKEEEVKSVQHQQHRSTSTYPSPSSVSATSIERDRAVQSMASAPL